jgi:hypothetical protein
MKCFTSGMLTEMIRSPQLKSNKTDEMEHSTETALSTLARLNQVEQVRLVVLIIIFKYNTV